MNNKKNAKMTLSRYEWMILCADNNWIFSHFKNEAYKYYSKWAPSREKKYFRGLRRRKADCHVLLSICWPYSQWGFKNHN